MSADRPNEPARPGAEERRQVQVALHAKAMAGYLQEAFTRAAGSPVREPASCHILCAKYEPGQYCAVVYRLGAMLLTGFLAWPDPEHYARADARWLPEPGMYVYRFEHDPALPGLRVATSEPDMAAALQRVLPECADGSHHVVRCRVTPERYRPGQRCTLRVDACLRGSHGDWSRRTLYAKVYDDPAEMLLANEVMRSLAGSPGARTGVVAFARPIAVLQDIRVMLQEAVPGLLLESYLKSMAGGATAGDPRGWTGVVRSAAAVAQVHAVPLVVARRRLIEEELGSFVERAGRAAAVHPPAGEPLLALARALPAWRGRLDGWGGRTALIHGDCKPNQMLFDGERIALLDFDTCAMADPAADVGTYLATLRQLGIWQSLRAKDSVAAQSRTAWLRALEERFLDEYCAETGSSADFRLRATWYEAVALLRKALRAFARSPRSALPVGEAREAWRCLDRLPDAGSGPRSR